jgi:hypothetical protein
MGHSSPRAALIYQHATAERDGAIADALDRLVAGTLAASSRPEPPLPLRPPTHQALDQRFCGGDDRTRTGDPLLAKQVL